MPCPYSYRWVWFSLAPTCKTPLHRLSCRSKPPPVRAMARQINRRNFFIIDRVLDALDRAQDFTDRTTLRKYEDYQDYQTDKKKHDDAAQQAKEEKEHLEEIREKITALGRQVTTLLHAVEEIKKRQTEIDKVKMDRPF